MTGRAYAVAGGKGGVGKTTTVVNLGVMLRVAGHRVAVVDADLGMANLATVLGVDHHPTLHDVLAGEATVEEALVEEPAGFGVVPGVRELSGFAAADPDRLESVVERLTHDYDVVLIDTGAGLSHEVVLPFGMADGVLLVTTPDRAAVGDAEKTAELVGLSSGSVVGVVVTRARGEIDTGAIEDRLDEPVLAVVPEDDAIPASIDAGKPLITLEPDSQAAAAYRNLVPAFRDRIEIDVPATAVSTVDGVQTEATDPEGSEADGADGADPGNVPGVDGGTPDPQPATPASDQETSRTGTDAIPAKPADTGWPGQEAATGRPDADKGPGTDPIDTESPTFDAIEDAEPVDDEPVEIDSAEKRPGGGSLDPSEIDRDTVALGEEAADALADALADATDLADDPQPAHDPESDLADRTGTDSNVVDQPASAEGVEGEADGRNGLPDGIIDAERDHEPGDGGDQDQPISDGADDEEAIDDETAGDGGDADEDDAGDETPEVAIPEENGSSDDGISIPETGVDQDDEAADQQAANPSKRGLLSRILHPFG